MDPFFRARKTGVLAILFAVVLRLLDAGIPSAIAARQSISTETETGQDVRSLPSFGTLPLYPAESPPPVPEPEPALPSFDEADLERISVSDFCHAGPELSALLTQRLEWELADGLPAVLILHTHTTECYTRLPDQEYAEHAPYRTLEESCNLLAVGDRLAQRLEEAGMAVIHDRSLHDYPAYTTAYTHARKETRAILAEHPQIRLILDLHRDAAESGGKQLRTEAVCGGQTAAQLMTVIGTGMGGLGNDNWQQNLSLALKLTAQLEQLWPGICRPIQLRSQRFNQDLGSHALLIEVGAAGNTLPEALLAADVLADALTALGCGTE